MDFNQGLLPDTSKECKATFVISIVVAEPLRNGNWRPIHVNNASLGVVLEGHNHQDLVHQINQKIIEIKDLWKDKIISLENSQIDVALNPSKTEEQ